MEKTTRDQVSRRMCAGCGGRAEPKELIRLVVGPSAPFVAVDLGRKLGGRGVSVHPRRVCVRQAIARGSLAKALRGLAEVRPETVERLIVGQLDSRVAGLVSSARRVRAIALGTEAVRASLASGKGELLIVAADGRGRIDEITKMATAIGCATATWGTKASVGLVLSRQELAVFLVTDRGIASAILECLTQVGALSEDE